MLFKKISGIHNAGKTGRHIIACVTEYNFSVKSAEKDET